MLRSEEAVGSLGSKKTGIIPEQNKSKKVA